MKRSNLGGINLRRKELDSIKCLLERGMATKAMSEIIKYMEKYPDDMYGKFTYGRILVENGRLDEAKEVYTEISNSYSKNKYSSLAALGDIAILEGQMDLAREYYKRVLSESEYEEEKTAISYAKLESREKNFEEALQILDSLENQSLNVKMNKAKILSIMNRLDEAIELLESTNESSKSKELLLEKFKLLNKQIEYTEFEERTAKINGINTKEESKEDCETLLEEAKVALKYKEYDYSIACCNKLISVGEYYHNEIHIILGMAYQEKRDYDKAIEYFNIATTSASNGIKGCAYYYLGNLQFAKGNLKEAETSFINSITTNNDHIPARYYKLISLYIKQDKIELAREVFNKLKEAAPVEAKESECEILLASLSNMPLPKRSDIRRYKERQIVNYSESEALDHIIKHHTKQTINTSASIFKEHIDIKKLFETIKDQMTEDNRINEDMMDTYEIDYPSAGYFNESILNKIRVIAIPKSKKIISMHPSEEGIIPPLGFFKNSISSQTNNRSDRAQKFYKRLEKKKL